jgi:hypothetical protein
MRKAVDTRTRTHRHERLQENWAAVKDSVVTAYLFWMGQQSLTPSHQPPQPSPPDSMWDFDIDVIDIFTLSRRAHIIRSGPISIAEALVQNGYLGSSPESPTFAVSLRTLQHYHRLRIRKPSFSFEAFAKVICDSYGVRQFIFLLDRLSLICCRIHITPATGPPLRMHLTFMS